MIGDYGVDIEEDKSINIDIFKEMFFVLVISNLCVLCIFKYVF